MHRYEVKKIEDELKKKQRIQRRKKDDFTKLSSSFWESFRSERVVVIENETLSPTELEDWKIVEREEKTYRGSGELFSKNDKLKESGRNERRTWEKTKDKPKTAEVLVYSGRHRNSDVDLLLATASLEYEKEEKDEEEEENVIEEIEEIVGKEVEPTTSPEESPRQDGNEAESISELEIKIDLNDEKGGEDESLARANIVYRANDNSSNSNNNNNNNTGPQVGAAAEPQTGICPYVCFYAPCLNGIQRTAALDKVRKQRQR